MKKSTKVLIAVCAIVSVAIAACAAVSVYMTKECEKNKPCKMSFGLFRRNKDEDEDEDLAVDLDED